MWFVCFVAKRPDVWQLNLTAVLIFALLQLCSIIFNKYEFVFLSKQLENLSVIIYRYSNLFIHKFRLGCGPSSPYTTKDLYMQENCENSCTWPKTNEKKKIGPWGHLSKLSFSIYSHFLAHVYVLRHLSKVIDSQWLFCLIFNSCCLMSSTVNVFQILSSIIEDRVH